MTMLIMETWLLVTTLMVASARVVPTKDWLATPHIAGGEIAEPGQFPYQVAVKHGSGNLCGGSIISDRWVLTAAHCVIEKSRFELIVGDNNIRTADEERRQTFLCDKAIVHPRFNYSNAENDVALIQTPTPIKFTDYVSPVSLPGANLVNKSFENKIATVSGWGRTSANSISSPYLRFVNLTVISNKECKARYDSHEPILETTLCAQGAHREGACPGDSGGPLVINVGGNLTQIGVVSFCSDYGCDRGIPHGYSRLTKYVSWIRQITGTKTQ